MKKLLSFVVALGSVLFFAATPAYAAQLEPLSGNFPPGSVVTVVARAHQDIAGQESSAVQIRLHLIGPGSVIQESSWDDRNAIGFLSIGTCNVSNAKTTPSSICVDMAKTSGFIEAGELLGTFKVTLGTSPGNTTLSSVQGNGYLIDTTLVDLSGDTLATYTVQQNLTPTNTPITPVTGIEDYPVFMIAGLMVIFLGVCFFIWREKSQNLAEKTN